MRRSISWFLTTEWAQVGGQSQELWSAAQGPTLGACVGLASLLVVFLRYVSLSSMGRHQEVPMKQPQRLAAFAISILETIWAIGTSSVAGALPT